MPYLPVVPVPETFADSSVVLIVGTCLAAYAKYIFTELPSVTSLSIGRQWPQVAMIGQIQPRTSFYVRAKLVDPDGGTTLVPMVSSKAAVRDMEQSSDILDLELDNLFERYGQKVGVLVSDQV